MSAPGTGRAWPDLAYEWPVLRAAAARLLSEREAHYPRLVRDGRMSADAADDGLTLARALASDWAATEGWATPCPARSPAHRAARAAMLEAAAALARKRGDARLAEAFDTLRWWDTAQPQPIGTIVNINLAARAATQARMAA